MDLNKEIEEIKNKRVDLDRALETSWTRKIWEKNIKNDR